MVGVADHRDGDVSHQDGAFQPFFFVEAAEFRPERIGVVPAIHQEQAPFSDRLHRGYEGIDVGGDGLSRGRIDHHGHGR